MEHTHSKRTGCSSKRPPPSRTKVGTAQHAEESLADGAELVEGRERDGHEAPTLHSCQARRAREQVQVSHELASTSDEVSRAHRRSKERVWRQEQGGLASQTFGSPRLNSPLLMCAVPCTA